LQKFSCNDFSDAEIIDLVKKDYLNFTLNYELHQHDLHFQNTDGVHFNLIGNGILCVTPSTSNRQNTVDVNKSTDGNTEKSIVLSCAVHGNETAPIEICNEIIRELVNAELCPKHTILFLFGNIPAMHIGERFVEENLNRLFAKGLKSKSKEGERAIELMQCVDKFFDMAKGEKLHYDLHTAIRPSKNEKFAVYPFLHGKAYSKQQLAFLSACDVNTILLSQSPTTTFSYYSSLNHGAHAFTVELGKVKPFGQNDMAQFTAVNIKLRELISNLQTNESDYADCSMDIFTVNQVINKHKDDFRLHFGDDIANFTEFKKDEILASEADTVYKAQHDGEAIVFPNANVAIGQRAILTVIPYEI
jgi:succinylglutamate desuccinylase